LVEHGIMMQQAITRQIMPQPIGKGIIPVNLMKNIIMVRWIIKERKIRLKLQLLPLVEHGIMMPPAIMRLIMLPLVGKGIIPINREM